MGVGVGRKPRWIEINGKRNRKACIRRICRRVRNQGLAKRWWLNANKFWRVHSLVEPTPLFKPMCIFFPVPFLSSCVLCLMAQLCSALCDPMDCSPPGSFVHGDSPGKNAGVGCHAFFQWIFPTQGWNPGLLHWRWVLYSLSHQGSPRVLEWVAYPFARESSNSGNKPGSPALQAASLPAELPEKPCHPINTPVCTFLSGIHFCPHPSWFSLCLLP